MEKIERENILNLFLNKYLPTVGGENVRNDLKGLKIKKIDYSNNILSPEKVAYKIYFTLYGVNKRFCFYPNTVGFQVF